MFAVKCVVLSACFCLALSQTALPSTWQRGTNFFAFSVDDLIDPITIAELHQLPSVIPGIDMVAVQWMWQQDNATSNVMRPFHSTPSMDSLAGFTHAAHSSGLQVYFKPIIVAADGNQMAELNPSNVTEWFESYTNVMTQIASLAQLHKVEKLAIGIELLRIVTPAANGPLWRRLIGTVRSLYNGTLTYGSNPLLGETAAVTFWDVLDDIGIDLYIPMVPSQLPNTSLTPTAQVMESTYTFIFEKMVFSWYQASNFSKQGPSQKLLFVSESGYPSSNKGLQQPWILPPKHVGCVANYARNDTAQAAAFSVQFSVMQSPKYAAAFNGFIQFWYGQPGTSDFIGNKSSSKSLYDCGWTPQGKNATLNVLRNAFKKV